jgi:DNA repair protein RadC
VEMSRIKDLPSLHRPRERALRYGIESLTLVELFAIIINSGIVHQSALDIAGQLLTKHRGMKKLMSLSIKQLIDIKGINSTTALRIKATLEIAKRLELELAEEDITFNNAQQIWSKYRLTMAGNAHEQMLLIMLNNRNKFIKEKVIYQGTSDTIVLSNRELFVELFLNDACKYIIVHNHPSDNIQPSQNDIATTVTIKNEGLKVGLMLLDHIIIGASSYFSMAEHKLI